MEDCRMCGAPVGDVEQVGRLFAYKPTIKSDTTSYPSGSLALQQARDLFLKKSKGRKKLLNVIEAAEKYETDNEVTGLLKSRHSYILASQGSNVAAAKRAAEAYDRAYDRLKPKLAFVANLIALFDTALQTFLNDLDSTKFHQDLIAGRTERDVRALLQEALDLYKEPFVDNSMPPAVYLNKEWNLVQIKGNRLKTAAV